MDRFQFTYNGRTYTDMSPPERHFENSHFDVVKIPDEVREESFDAGVDTANKGDDDMATTAQEVETTKSKKAPAKKTKAPATTSTKFSAWCKANNIKDTVKARRALRANSYSAPYDPSDKDVQRIVRESQK